MRRVGEVAKRMVVSAFFVVGVRRRTETSRFRKGWIGLVCGLGLGFFGSSLASAKPTSFPTTRPVFRQAEGKQRVPPKSLSSSSKSSIKSTLQPSERNAKLMEKQHLLLPSNNAKVGAVTRRTPTSRSVASGKVRLKNVKVRSPKLLPSSGLRTLLLQLQNPSTSKGVIPSIVSRIRAYGPGALDGIERAFSSASEVGKERLFLGVAAFGKGAVPLLQRAFQSKDWVLRSEAAYCAGGLGLEARPLLAALGHALEDHDRRVRREAATALRKLGPMAFGMLAKAIHQKDIIVSLMAIRKLAETPKPNEAALLGALLHKDPIVRGVARRALSRLAEGKTALWKRALQHPNARIRSRVLPFVARLGKLGVPLLVRALRDVDAQVRWQAAASLGTLGEAAKSAQGALLGLHQDAVARVRAQAVRALGALEVPNNEAKLMFTKWLRDPSQEVRAQVIRVLSRSYAELTSLMREGIRDKSALVRLLTLRSLRKQGRITASVFCLTLAHPDRFLRQFGAMTLRLWNISLEEQQALLRTALGEGVLWVRLYAVRSLASFGKRVSKASRQALSQLQTHPSLELRQAVQVALKVSTPKPPPGRRLLKRKSPRSGGLVDEGKERR